MRVGYINKYVNTHLCKCTKFFNVKKYATKGLPFIGMEWKQFLLLLLVSVNVDQSRSCVSSTVRTSPMSVKSRGNHIMNNSKDYPQLEITYLPLQSCCSFFFPVGVSTHLMKPEGYKARSVFMRQRCVSCR